MNSYETVESVEYGHYCYRLSGLSTNMLSNEQTFPPDFFNRPIKIRSVVRLFVSNNKIKGNNSISARTRSQHSRLSCIQWQWSQCCNILSHSQIKIKYFFLVSATHVIRKAYHAYKTLAKPSNPSVSFLFCEFQLVFHDEFSRNQT